MTFSAANQLDRESDILAPYAMRTCQSRGRRHAEAEHPYRTLYQRDRDRIVHSTAFRRLMYKTQVLVNHYGDHHRTRLTHTLEVAQISRTIARQLGLNEDLTEAIALVHDLGHPPFGHAGEESLDECMAGHGGFEHNRQGLRLVEFLEYRYPSFPGLNLTWEVLESMALRTKRRDAPEAKDFLGIGQPLLEAQVVDAADSLAYNTHDIDDAVSAELIDLNDLNEVEMCRRAGERLKERHGPMASVQFQPTLVRYLIEWQVSDLLENTRRKLQSERIQRVEDVRNRDGPLVGPGSEIQMLKAGLEEFLHQRVYRHHRVMRMASKGRRFVQELFQEYVRNPLQIPGKYAERVKSFGILPTISDYLSGMTDRYAQDEYLRLFHPYKTV